MKDFFISYNKADRAWAVWIAWQLEQVGYSVVIQEWDFRPGSNFVLEMDKANQEAHRTIAVLSSNYLDAPYPKAEWADAFRRDPTGEQRTLVPVRVQPCHLHGLLASIVSIDLVGRDQASAREALLQGIRSDRGKPGIPPTFPGRSQPPPFPGSERPPAEASSTTAVNAERNRNTLRPAPQSISAFQPGRSIDFVIITALQEELDALLAKLPSPQRLPPTEEDVRVYYQVDLPITLSDGVTGAYRLVLLSLLGMGRVQAASATTDAIRRWHPRSVLLVGIAGGIATAGVNRGDVLISDLVADYELQKLTVEGEQIRWEPYRADPRLLAASRHQGKEWRRLIKKRRPFKGIPKCLIGPLATGDKVVAIKAVLDRYLRDWPKLIGIEMEAGGLASAAFQSAVQPGFLMIRGVSDLADENKDDSWRCYACHAAAAYAVGLLQSGPVPLRKQEERDDQREKHVNLDETQERDQGDLSTSILSLHSSHRHDTYQLVSLPPYYIERSQIGAEVQKALLNETSPIALTSATMTTPAALHGMGGIGKTSVARALCDDPTVQQAFPDGILWATLGQNPDLVNQLRLWIQALGGTVSENAPTIDGLRFTLDQILQKRSCLLILDDVWRSEDAKQFRLGGPSCRLLLTTRQAEIAHNLGARIQAIPLLPLDDAITLLEAWAQGHLASVERSVKEHIVKRLGSLPLAIRLAGPQLIHLPPNEWLHTFDVRDLKLYQVETTHDSLEVTLDLSLEMLPADVRWLYLNLAIFQEDEAIPRVAIEGLWRELSGFSTGKTALLLGDLADRALLERFPDESLPTVRLHDLLRDLIRIRLGNDRLIAAHRALLNAYRRTSDGRRWHAAADDGYLYDHLAYHLRAAGEFQELKGLFVNQNWLRARVAQHGYTYDGYLADLSLSLEYASTETREQIEAGQAPESFAECLRYTLIHASINSIAENYVPELIARAVQVGLWTTDQAMSIASKIPQSEQQANTYLLLLETEQLSSAQREKAQQEAVDYALAIWDEEAKARMLAPLAPHVTGDLFERVVAAIASMTNRFAYARISLALVPRLVGERRTQILKNTLDAILTFIDEIEGRDLFIALVPLLSEELLATASHAILGNTHRLYRSATLAAVAPRLTGTLLEQAFEETLKLPEAWEQAECLSVLAKQLTEALLGRAIQVALAVENEWARSHMIAALASRMEGASLQQALENVLALSDDQPRERALTALASWRQLAGESLELARQTAHDLLRKGLLWPALVFAHQGQFEHRDQMIGEIFKALLATKNRWAMVEQLRILSPELSENQLEEVVTVAIQKESRLTGSSLLEVVAPFLTSGLVQRALETILREQDEENFPYLLSVLAPRLSESQLEQALQVALNIEEKGTRLRTLEKLAPSLNDKQCDQALTAALELVLSAEPADERVRFGAFVTLAPHLKGEPLKRALKATEEIKDEWARRRMLAALVPQMSGELLEQALQAALVAKAERAYLRTLSLLAPRLEDEQRRQTLTYVLEAALTMKDDGERAEVLTLLAPCLAGEQRNQALVNAFKAALVLPKEWYRVQLLVTLVPFLLGSLRDEAIESTWENVQALRNERLQALILERLIPHLNDHELEQVRQFVTGLRDTLARTQLSVALAPRLPNEERKEILMNVLASILEEREGQLRARLLSMLAPQLSGEQRAQALRQILELARLIESEQTRTEVFVNVIPLLAGKEQQQTLQTVLTISNQLILRWALLKLAPQLHGEAREQAIEAAMEAKEEWFRAAMLAAFLPVVSDQTLFLKVIRKAMVDVLPMVQRMPLQGVIQNYLGHDVFTTPLLSPKILGALVSQMIEICQEWNW